MSFYLVGLNSLRGKLSSIVCLWEMPFLKAAIISQMDETLLETVDASAIYWDEVKCLKWNKSNITDTTEMMIKSSAMLYITFQNLLIAKKQN